MPLLLGLLVGSLLQTGLPFPDPCRATFFFCCCACFFARSLQPLLHFAGLPVLLNACQNDRRPRLRMSLQTLLFDVPFSQVVSPFSFRAPQDEGQSRLPSETGPMEIFFVVYLLLLSASVVRDLLRVNFGFRMRLSVRFSPPPFRISPFPPISFLFKAFRFRPLIARNQEDRTVARRAGLFPDAIAPPLPPHHTFFSLDHFPNRLPPPREYTEWRTDIRRKPPPLLDDPYSKQAHPLA